MERNTFKICVTGAAGNIAYSLIPQLVSGHIFGTRTSIYLNLLDVPETAYALKGLILELEDGTYPLLKKVEFGFDPRVMFRDCDLIIFLGGASRQPGQDRRDLLNINAKIFREQGMALNEVGKPDCRCLVVANPCHTNCFVLQKFCPNIPRKNFTSLSRLDHNRAVGQLASKLGVPMQQVKKVVVWGNHSWSQFPDISHSEINGKKLEQMVSAEYIQNDFITQIQHRAAQVMHQRKKPAVMSGARAIENHLKDWYFGTHTDDWVSMGVISDGSYGIPEGLVCSMPVICKDSEYEIVKGLDLNEFSKVQVQHAVDELIEERDDTLHEIEA